MHMMENNKCRLMVIDDEAIVCKRLKQIFEKSGYDVSVFIDSTLAIGELSINNYDIIVTDLKMDDVDGMKILERAKETNPEAKVIMLSGFGETETVREAFRKGVFDFLPKPVEIDTIKEAIARAEKELRRLCAPQSPR
jgi:DNA-binding NtrC family response regulator